MESRWARVGRGTIAAAVATFVAALSHTIGGDSAPSWFGVLASFVLSLSVCTALAGRSISWFRLTLSVAISQVLFHTLFSGIGTPAGSASHVHSTQAMVMPTGMSAHDDRMLLAHVIAGIITVIVLRFGERAFWSIADSARLVLRRLLPSTLRAVAAPARVIHAVVGFQLAPRIIHPPSTHRHRGPPLQFVSI